MSDGRPARDAGDVVYQNRWFRVIREGRMHFIEEAGAGNGAAVLAMQGDDLILLEMRRASQGGAVTLEIPRGGGDAGEDAIECARRELREETGYDLPVSDFAPLGRVLPNTGLLSSRVHVFAALVPEDMAPGERDDEAIRVRRVPMGDVTAMIASGEIEDGFTLAALSMLNASAGTWL